MEYSMRRFGIGSFYYHSYFEICPTYMYQWKDCSFLLLNNSEFMDKPFVLTFSFEEPLGYFELQVIWVKLLWTFMLVLHSLPVLGIEHSKNVVTALCPQSLERERERETVCVCVWDSLVMVALSDLQLAIVQIGLFLNLLLHPSHWWDYRLVLPPFPVNTSLTHTPNVCYCFMFLIVLLLYNKLV